MKKISSRTTYLELLLENPRALQQVIELCAQSQLISEQLARYPILLDELLNTEALRHPLPFTQYPAELHQYLLRLPLMMKNRLSMLYVNLNKQPY